MYLTEWDEEAYRTVMKQESWEDGKAEGKIEGRIEGITDINELNKCLIQDGRLDDLKRAFEDIGFQNSLLAEYNIGSYKKTTNNVER